MGDFHGVLDTIYGTEEEHGMGRLTDEQVAEALEWADAWLSATYVSREAQQYLLIARFMRQVSADLSAAKARADAAETDRLTWMSALGKKLTAAGFAREDESLMGMADDSLQALSALQEKAREAVEAYMAGENLVSAARLRDALSALRSLLPEEGR